MLVFYLGVIHGIPGLVSRQLAHNNIISSATCHLYMFASQSVQFHRNAGPQAPLDHGSPRHAVATFALLYKELLKPTPAMPQHIQEFRACRIWVRSGRHNRSQFLRSLTLLTLSFIRPMYLYCGVWLQLA